MSYLALEFYIFVIIACLAYYAVGAIFKGRFQWCVLLAGSVFFYALVIRDAGSVAWLALPVAVSYAGGIAAHKYGERPRLKKIITAVSVILAAAPLITIKLNGTLFDLKTNPVAPIGLSFFTLQLIAYTADCGSGKIVPQKNPLKHLLFSTFFPYIIQGPIPRYEFMKDQLFGSHRYDSEKVMHGVQKIIFGFFLKYMIADKAAGFVSLVFDGDGSMVGSCIILAAVLYAFQLYTDFYSCTLICQGVALLFGIRLPENFGRPYLSLSIKDFWRRWHISLSTWLRDYIYIPLGGSRKGRARKYVNLIVTFLVSGFWHGNYLQFIVWGGVHAIYQMIGDCTHAVKEKAYEAAGVARDSMLYKSVKRLGTFILVTAAWILFRAKDLETGIRLIRDAFRYYNPWRIFGARFFELGMDYREFGLLGLSLLILGAVSRAQEKGVSLHERFREQHLIIRWAVYICAIVFIWVFGTYGFGFNAQDFIYGGF